MGARRHPGQAPTGAPKHVGAAVQSAFPLRADVPLLPRARLSRASSPEQGQACARAQSSPLGFAHIHLLSTHLYPSLHQRTRMHACTCPDGVTRLPSPHVHTRCHPPSCPRALPVPAEPPGRTAAARRPPRSCGVRTVGVGASPAGGDALEVGGQSQVGGGQADGGHAGSQLGGRGELQQGDVVVQVGGVPVGVRDGLPKNTVALHPRPPGAAGAQSCSLVPGPRPRSFRLTLTTVFT